MKTKQILLASILVLISKTVFANISIYPYRIDFKDTDRKRVQSVRVINSSNKTQTYRVSMVNFLQDEQGRLFETKDTKGKFSKNFVTWSPRQFTLAPNKVQTINVARRSLATAPDGELVSHLKISEVNMGTPKTEKKESAPDALSVEINALFAVTLPVTIEKGEGLFSKTSLVSYKKNKNSIDFVFKREGNKSSRFNIVILDNEEEVARLNNVKIYDTVEKLKLNLQLIKPLTNSEVILKLEDAQSKDEILKQKIKL